MRIYLKLTRNKEKCPFEYQSHLVGALHKWIGKNDIHDGLSLYSMSWFSPGKCINKKYLNFPDGATWFISSPDNSLIKSIISGIQKDASVAFGMNVIEVIIQETPKFENTAKLYVETPVLVKRNVGERDIQYSYNDKEVDDLLTETLKRKLRKFGIDDSGIEVSFDKNYYGSKTKLVKYKGIGNKANLCPIIIKGSPEAIGFAWNVGVGNSTGIGFGALK